MEKKIFDEFDVLTMEIACSIAIQTSEYYAIDYKRICLEDRGKEVVNEYDIARAETIASLYRYYVATMQLIADLDGIKIHTNLNTEKYKVSLDTSNIEGLIHTNRELIERVKDTTVALIIQKAIDILETIQRIC